MQGVIRRGDRWRRRARVLLTILVAAILVVATAAGTHRILLGTEVDAIAPPGELVTVNGHEMHVHAVGGEGGPTVVLMAGAATIAPSLDFAPLLRAFGDDVRAVVVEKPGYGYSAIAGAPRSLQTLVDEQREALRVAGIAAPYVLAAHSMSGLEAMHWAREYPDEVVAVIGLDMSTPEAYESQDATMLAFVATVGGLLVQTGVQRVPGLYPGVVDRGLTQQEREQQEMLLARNAGNPAHLAEAAAVLGNAEALGTGIVIEVPLLLFGSDGRELHPGWSAIQRDLAQRSGGQLIELDCGHAVHRCDPETIAEGTVLLLDTLADHG